MMAAIRGVLRDMIDDDWLAVLPNFVTDRCLPLQFATGLKAELKAVLDTARDPAVFSDPRDRSKAHARGATNNVKDRGHRRDSADRFDIILEFVNHFPLLR